jgi:anaerobic C4-dicarboxylate transporter
MQALKRSNLGANIGNINVVAPTCANDIAILAGNEQELQSILDIVHNLASNDLTQINPSKSELVPLECCYNVCKAR